MGINEAHGKNVTKIIFCGVIVKCFFTNGFTILILSSRTAISKMATKCEEKTTNGRYAHCTMAHAYESMLGIYFGVIHIPYGMAKSN
jgi:hypothetical protein